MCLCIKNTILMPIVMLQVENSDLICWDSLEGVTSCHIVRLLICFVVTFVTHGMQNISLKQNTAAPLRAVN
jgi:hypothetical protein